MKARKIVKIIYLLLMLFAATVINRAQCIPASTAAGALDTCFDGDGRVTTQISAGFDEANAITIQLDGKILVAGTADRDAANGNSNFALVRYNPDGSLDTSFDGNGIVTTDFGSNSKDVGRAVALQPDGKIVVAGYTELNPNNFAFALARYNSDGSLDTSFDGDGKVTFDVSAGNIDEANGVVLQVDGKIVVAGDSNSGPVSSIVARFNADGSLDNSFDTDGWTIVAGMKNTNAVALNAEGRIDIAGSSGTNLGGVAQLNSNGSPSMFFGNNGVRVYSFGNIADEAFGMRIGVDGNIFVAGSSNTGASGVCGSLHRFYGEGSPGVKSVSCDENSFSALVLQTDLKIVTAGASINPASGFAVKRHLDAHSVDTSFGTAGKVTIQFAPANPNEAANARGIAVQRDNQIVSVGGTRDSAQSTTSKFAVARLFSGLQAPHAERFDFDGDRKADVSVFRPSENRWYVFRSSDFGVTERFFGQSGDCPVPADFDGDGKTDFAVFRPGGAWRWLSSISGIEEGFQWGGCGDIPRVSDFNGDGRMDFVLFRLGENNWYRHSIIGEFYIQHFGLSGDKPVAGDFDGDGKSDKAIFRPSTGDWWYQSSINNAQLAVHWGISTDIPTAGDYDGDGKTDFAVYRPETGIWYIINSSNFSFTIINFGLAEDKPVPADYDGDGKVDIAVFRPSTGVWYLLRSTAGFAAMQFGISTDVPVPNVYIQ